MSECVVRMEMPSNCFDCILHCDGSFADENGYCRGIPPYMDYDCRPSGEMRPSWCPIICQLPEGHGRLVDAVPVKFIDEVIEYLTKCRDYAIHEETKATWGEQRQTLIMLLHEWDAWNECGRTGKYGEREVQE